MKISVIGTGYVGLVTGTCLAEQGNEVICMDIDKNKIEMLSNGRVPIYEPGLEELVKRNLNTKRLKFTTNLEEGINNSLVNFIAVPTPSSNDGKVNLNYVDEVASQISPLVTEYKLIVNKSTVPPGTSERVRKIIKQNATSDFEIVSNPEFLKEGDAVRDFLKPDRVVIGVNSEKAKEIMKELYHPFVLNKNPVLFMSNIAAEIVKYASNTFLATKISFINNIANLCDEVGANIHEVKEGIVTDHRIGSEFLFPGLGYGGSCFPKDVDGLIHIYDELGIDSDLFGSVRAINNNQVKIFLNKIDSYYKYRLKGNTLTLLGLAFKPETDDIREAPSLKLIDYLSEKGVKISACDPKAIDNTRRIYPNINYFENPYDALKDSDGMVLVTEWTSFRSLDFKKVKSLLKIPVVFDGRNIYSKKDLVEKGFDYFGIGV